MVVQLGKTTVGLPFQLTLFSLVDFEGVDLQRPVLTSPSLLGTSNAESSKV